MVSILHTFPPHLSLLQYHNYISKCVSVEKPILCPQDEVHHPIIHTTLQVYKDAPLPDPFNVKVFDPSKNINIPFILKSTDTAAHLIKKYLQMKPELKGSLNLAYNGKQVSAMKTMCELGVKPGDVFITFQRCSGG